MPQYKVLLCQFPGNRQTHIEPTLWVARTVWQMSNDPTIGSLNLDLFHKSDTPITMTRNQALAKAEIWGADYVVMIDSDMLPDCVGPHDGGKPFWDVAWPFIRENRCGMIAAPYVGPAPEECVYVFRNNTVQDQQPNPNFKLEMYDRDTASKMRGVQKAAALATGLCIIDMRAVKDLRKPYFDYEWKDRNGRGEDRCPHCHTAIPGERVDKASTEDVFFSRNLTYVGWPIYCTWDSWAAHIKYKYCGPPQRIPAEMFPQTMRKWANAMPAGDVPDPYVDPTVSAAVNTQAVDAVAVPTVSTEWTALEPAAA